MIGSAAFIQYSPASAPVFAYEAVEGRSLADREGPRRSDAIEGRSLADREGPRRSDAVEGRSLADREGPRRDDSVAHLAEPAAAAGRPGSAPATTIVAVELIPELRPVAVAAPARISDTRALTALTAKRRRDVAHARAALNELERGLSTIDTAIAVLNASAAEAEAKAQAIATVDAPESDAVARAQSAYNEAIARERRAATLAAHGVPARQELEAAQMQVRDAAAALSAARRAADQVAAVTAAKALQARAQAEIALAQEQQRRAEQVTQIAEARRTLREAEEALAAAAAGK